MRKPTGGKPGRPKGSGESVKLALKMREKMMKKLDKEWNEMIEAQIDVAKGLVVKKNITLPNGKTYPKYYLEKPDGTTGNKLIEHAIGKAKEQIEHSGSVRTLVEVVSELDAQDEEA